MAGNNSIQFLRGSGTSSNAQLLPGQPYYDYANNKLFIGGSNGTAINKATEIGIKTNLSWFRASGDSNVRFLLGIFHQGGIMNAATNFINSIPSTQTVSNPTIEGIGWVFGVANFPLPVYGYSKYNGTSNAVYAHYVRDDGAVLYIQISTSSLTYLI